MTEPTDDEIAFFARAEGIKVRTGAGAVKLVRAALAKWCNQAQAEEPVAYSIGNTLKWHEGKGLTNAQLFAAPQPVAREPLTDEQIDTAWRSVDYKQPYDSFRIAVARAIEAAHGIKGGQHGL